MIEEKCCLTCGLFLSDKGNKCYGLDGRFYDIGGDCCHHYSEKEPSNNAALRARVAELEAENKELTLTATANAQVAIDALKELPLVEVVDDIIADLRAQLKVMKKALELACGYICDYSPGLACEPVRDGAYWLHKASKAGDK